MAVLILKGSGAAGRVNIPIFSVLKENFKFAEIFGKKGR